MYTTDNRLANWPLGTNGTTSSVVGTSPAFDICNCTFSSARYYFLRGNNNQTTWKAINDPIGKMEMAIHKQPETISLYYYNPSLNSYVRDTGDIGTVQDQPGYTSLLADARHSGYFFLYSTPFEPTSTVTVRSSFDTCQLRYSGKYYTMVRQ